MFKFFLVAEKVENDVTGMISKLHKFLTEFSNIV